MTSGTESWWGKLTGAFRKATLRKVSDDRGPSDQPTERVTGVWPPEALSSVDLALQRAESRGHVIGNPRAIWDGENSRHEAGCERCGASFVFVSDVPAWSIRKQGVYYWRGRALESDCIRSPADSRPVKAGPSVEARMPAPPSGLFLDRKQANGWEELLEMMPDREFDNLTRSTIPLLAHRMGVPACDDESHYFEYTVSSLPGARPSHTDLMIVASDRATGIEAKSMEPRYPTVGDWLARSPATRAPVLKHWTELIRRATRESADEEKLLLCVYQMVHRLASVCSLRVDVPELRYVLFDVGTEHPDYLEDLSRLSEALHVGHSVTIRLEEVPTALTSAGQELNKELEPLSSPDRARRIRDELTVGGLFEFGTPEVRVVGT